MGVAHFDIVAEDVVVADLERRDARRLALALLDACQVILAVERDAAQVVQLGIHAVGDDAALLNLVVERIGVYLPRDAVAHAGHQVDLRRQRMQSVVVRGFERRLEQFDRKERILELHQFPGRHPRRGDTRRDTLHVAHQRHLLAHGVGQVGILDEMPDYVQPFVDLHGILDGMAIQRLSRRPPIGVSVRSMTSAKLHFSRPPFDENSSRLRIVNLSTHT